MRRESWVDPGFDCRGGKCLHEVKGEHGQHGDEWWYALVDESSGCAVSLGVFTELMPDPAERVKFIEIMSNRKNPSIFDYRRGYSFCLHTPFPVDEGDIHSEKAGRQDCRLVKPCFGQSDLYQVAEELWRRAGSPQQFEQPDSFWAELEQWFRERLPDLLAKRGATVRCLHCGGTGLIQRSKGEVGRG